MATVSVDGLAAGRRERPYVKYDFYSWYRLLRRKFKGQRFGYMTPVERRAHVCLLWRNACGLNNEKQYDIRPAYARKLRCGLDRLIEKMEAIQ